MKDKIRQWAVSHTFKTEILLCYVIGFIGIGSANVN